MPSRAILSITTVALAASLGLSQVASAASEVYIEQARGHAGPGTSVITKPTPESAAQPSQPAAAAPAATAPDTCNAQNAASSQACYTATQQSRPASH